MPTINKISTVQTRPQISFKSTYVTDICPRYYSMKSAIETEVSRFLSTKDNVRKLGEGVGGEVYTFTNPEFQNFVLKRNKEGHPDNYLKEYNNLRLLPTEKIGGQEAIARVFDSDRREYFLLSSLAEGRPVSAHSNPFTEKSLKSMFTKMFELDKLGIYHGDLNGKNVLISDTGEVSFIDYQWTQKVSDFNFFSSEKTGKLMLPIGHFPENAQMLEMAAIPKYIESLPDENARAAFMEMYLKAKAGYHNERYRFLKDYLDKGYYLVNRDIAKEALGAELAKALLFENPSKDIKSLELEKIQFLSDYRDAFRHVDSHLPSRNILASTSPYLCAVSSVQSFRKSVFTHTPFSPTPTESAYFKSMAEYGKYWYHNLVKFASETQDYVMRMLTKTYRSHEHKHSFYKHDRSPRIFPANRELLGSREYYDILFDNTHDMALYNFEDMLYRTLDVIEDHMVNGTKIEHNYDKFYSLLIKKEKFWKECSYLDYINAMQVMILKLREFESYLRHETNLPKLQGVIADTLEAVTDHVKGVYSDILTGLKYENACNIITKGYEHMRKFVFKI